MDYNYNNIHNANNIEVTDLPEKYRPISAWGYFGYQLLFLIPVAGFVILLVFSLSDNVNYNLRNFARSHFCFLAIYAVLLVISLIIRTITLFM